MHPLGICCRVGAQERGSHQVSAAAAAAAGISSLLSIVLLLWQKQDMKKSHDDGWLFQFQYVFTEAMRRERRCVRMHCLQCIRKEPPALHATGRSTALTFTQFRCPGLN